MAGCYNDSILSKSRHLRTMPPLDAIVVLGIFSVFPVVKAPLPLVPVAAVGLLSIFSGAVYKVGLNCRFSECCDAPWIPGNVTALERYLQERLYGQHIALDAVSKSLRGHLSHDNPQRALVLSLHGWTGGGKNYVSSIIARHLFREGMNSSFVHLWSATLHFSHAKDIDVYKDQIRTWIRGNVSACARSLFIFDEVEKMPGTLMDSIKPFIDHHERIGNVDYRKSIFILISNTGGEAINRIALEHWKSGGKREDLRLKDFEDAVAQSSYREDGGLKSSALIDRSLVTIVPFLPLERSHVRSCIRDDLLSKHYPVSDQTIDAVLSELAFFPRDSQLYSKRGCRPVSDKVNLIVEEMGTS